jgi:hypothetical protein
MLALQVNSGTDAVAGRELPILFTRIELQADHLRNEPLADRKQRLAKVAGSRQRRDHVQRHLSHDGAAVF